MSCKSFALILLVSGLAPAGEVSLETAPARAAAAANPYAGRAEAAAAGARLYRRYCAACHGDGARGSAHAPALATPRVADAPAGALFWVVSNGVLPRGMPAWSSLPPQQRWQIVTFLEQRARAGGPPLH